jgi:glycerol-3-phosphate cytidylyltransferase
MTESTSHSAINMKVGITASTFDLFHAGHVKMLEEAKQQCDYLIVALQVDPSIDREWKNKPIQTVVERYIQVSASQYVDEVVPYVTEQDLEDILSSFKIDVRIIGEEYKGQEFTGKDTCIKRNIDIYYNKREHRFSSSALRAATHKAESERSQKTNNSIIEGLAATMKAGPIDRRTLDK